MTEAQPAQRLSPWTLWFGGLAFFTCYLGQTVLGVVQPTVKPPSRRSMTPTTSIHLHHPIRPVAAT